MPIVVDELRFSYGERLVLDGVSCRFADGAMTALVGPSGSGKSTLIGLLVGQLRPDRGRIHYPDSLCHNGEIDLSRVAWVMQAANLFTRRSAIENVMLPLLISGVDRSQAEARADTALERTGLGDRVGDVVGRLSGGQRQRVAVARALATEAPLLIADEPTVALDRDNKDALVGDLLLAAADGAIVIVATHDPAVAARCHAEVHL